ncbi:MAG: cytochrome c family protein [Desulfoarculaceae bacterium]|nr:cytochrome c family protein [Desulfoarculaceae bacterium]
MKKTAMFAAAFALALGMGFTVNAMADNGPADLILQATVDAAAKPKPATFPHAKHQAMLTCADCHHGKDAAGKQVAFVEGQKIEKCESCHNAAAGMDKNIATFKDAAHTKCKGCHTEKKAGPTKCNECHK